MLRSLLLLTLTLVASCRHSPPPAPPPTPALDITLTPRFPEGGPVLEVELSFRGEDDGSTQVLLPHAWGGQEGYHRGIRGLRAVSADTVMSLGDSPRERLLHHPPGQGVTLAYTVFAPSQGSLTEPGRTYWPILGPHYFHLIGEAFLVHPGWDEDGEVAVSLTWRDLPPGWNVASSFGALREQISFTTLLRRLRHALYLAGDYRIHQVPVQGNPLTLAIRGQWRFPDQEAVDLARKIVQVERDFWGDHDFPYFLISMLPTGEQCCHYGGTGLTNAFATFISTDKGLDQRLAGLLAHELFHTWNGRKIGRQEPEELVYWFSEGFTNAYARLLCLRAGLISLTEYIRQINEVIGRYILSPVATAPNRRILEEFWSDQDVGELPYLRGEVLALRWNRAIRGRTGGQRSLDDLMRDLLAAAQRKGEVVSAHSLDRLVRPYLAEGILPDVERYMEEGELIPVETGLLGPCVTLELREVFRYDAGFDEEASKAGKVVTGVRPGSNAYGAGLREGMRLLGWSMNRGEPGLQAELHVDDGEGGRWIRYYPRGQALDVPAFALDKGQWERDPSACMMWFGVGEPSSP